MYMYLTGQCFNVIIPVGPNKINLDSYHIILYFKIYMWVHINVVINNNGKHPGKLFECKR